MTYIGGTNFEMSFYDQPDDMSSSPFTNSALQSARISNGDYSLGSSSSAGTASPTSSRTDSNRSDLSGSDATKSEEESEDDGMVFFGKETEQERAYREKLARQLAIESPAIGSRILKKRDSREFNRRKTMGCMRKERESLGGIGRPRKFSGGFYHKDTPEKNSLRIEMLPSPLSRSSQGPLADQSSNHADLAQDVFLQPSNMLVSHTRFPEQSATAPPVADIRDHNEPYLSIENPESSSHLGPPSNILNVSSGSSETSSAPKDLSVEEQHAESVRLETELTMTETEQSIGESTRSDPEPDQSEENLDPKVKRDGFCDEAASPTEEEVPLIDAADTERCDDSPVTGGLDECQSEAASDQTTGESDPYLLEEEPDSTPMRILDKGKGREKIDPSLDQICSSHSEPASPMMPSSSAVKHFASLISESGLDESDILTDPDSPLPTARAGPVILPGRYMRGEGYTPSPAAVRQTEQLRQREVSLSPLVEMRFGNIADLVPAAQEPQGTVFSATPRKVMPKESSAPEAAPPTPFLNHSSMTPRRLGPLGTATPSKSALTPGNLFVSKLAHRSPGLQNPRMIPPAVQPPRKLLKTSSLPAQSDTLDLDIAKANRASSTEQAVAERRKLISSQLDAVFRPSGPPKALPSPAPATRTSQFGQAVKPMQPRLAGVRSQPSAIVRQPMLLGSRGGSMMRSKPHETVTGDSSVASTAPSIAVNPSIVSRGSVREPIKKSTLGAGRETSSQSSLQQPVSTIRKQTATTLPHYQLTRAAPSQSPLKGSNVYNSTSRSMGPPQPRPPPKASMPSSRFGAAPATSLSKPTSLPVMKTATFVPRSHGQTSVMMGRVTTTGVGLSGPRPFKTFVSSSRSAGSQVVGLKSPARKAFPLSIADAGQGIMGATALVSIGPGSSGFSQPTASSSTRRISPPPVAGDRFERSTTPLDEPVTSSSHSPQPSCPLESSGPGRTPSTSKVQGFIKSTEATQVKSSVSPELEDKGIINPSALQSEEPRTQSDKPDSGVAMDGGEVDGTDAPRRSNRATPSTRSLQSRGRTIDTAGAASSRARSVPLSAAGSSSGASIVSDKELAKVTDLNTRRNEVYFCAINRVMVRREGPRPPSPTGKVRTIEEREEEERKMGRQARANRRDRKTSGDEGSDRDTTGDDQPALPPTKHARGPGDEEDYETPMRPTKKARKSQIRQPAADSPSATGVRRKRSRAGTGSSVPGSGKMVKWDKGLVILGADSQQCGGSEDGGARELKTCIKSKVQLDHFGNVANAKQPPPDLKRTKIAVAVILYDGEEPTIPIPGAPAAPTTAKGKNKK